MAPKRRWRSPRDVTPRYCKADPFEGAKQAVAECWRNLTAVGARPLAVTDNLNFGNPEKPEIMGEIVAAIDGIGEACRALDFPVVSGNCSLYNETNGEAILPTPAIGGVGLMKDVHRMATIAFKREGDAIILIGETKGHLGQSLYLREIEGREEGAAPPVDLASEKQQWRLRAQPDRERTHRHSARCFRRRPAGRAWPKWSMAGGIGADFVAPKIASGAEAAAFRRGSGPLCDRRLPDRGGSYQRRSKGRWRAGQLPSGGRVATN